MLLPHTQILPETHTTSPHAKNCRFVCPPLEVVLERQGPFRATMDEQSSRRWLETINRERKSKDAWKEKYLTKEELQRLQEEQDALARAEAEKPAVPAKLSEREGMLKRLAEYEVDPAVEAAEAAARPMTTYEAARQRVAAQVDAVRPRSHRMTQDLSTPSLLKDVGPGLWISINPGTLCRLRSPICRVCWQLQLVPTLSRIAAAAARRLRAREQALLHVVAARDARLGPGEGLGRQGRQDPPPAPHPGKGLCRQVPAARREALLERRHEAHRQVISALLLQSDRVTMRACAGS